MMRVRGRGQWSPWLLCKASHQYVPIVMCWCGCTCGSFSLQSFKAGSLRSTRCYPLMEFNVDYDRCWFYIFKGPVCRIFRCVVSYYYYHDDYYLWMLLLIWLLLAISRFDLSGVRCSTSSAFPLSPLFVVLNPSQSSSHPLFMVHSWPLIH